jgi:dTMP kinase
VNRGTFLVFEGLDGGGKSTQLARLAKRLREAGHDVVETAEPYSEGTWGPRIREMARSGRALPPQEELHWFEEQRREHVREVVEPGLRAGRVVLCDRYFLSSAAYQGARGFDAAAILARHEREFPVPDLVLLIDVDADTGFARLGGRGDASEPVFERSDFLARVAERFAGIGRRYVVRIPGAGSPDEVEHLVLSAVAERTSLLGA